MRIFSLILLLTLLSAPVLRGQNIHAVVPDSVDAEKFYMFYIHDNIVNAQDITPTDPQFGIYEYEEIVNRLASEGFTVISYPREKGTHPYLYADEVAAGVRRLLDTGVPAGHICILGAGQGGAIAAVTSSKVRSRDINVVLLGSCTEAYNAYWIEHDERVWGKVLSIYRPASEHAASCESWLAHCTPGSVSLYREVALQERSAPGFWYRPTADWVLPTLFWGSGKYELVRP